MTRLKWKLILVRLEVVRILTHATVLLGDKAQVEACFSPFGDSANLNARSVNGLR